jgi:hypothetical protein
MFQFYFKKLIRCPAIVVSVLLLVLSMVFAVVPFPSAYPVYLLEYALGLGMLPYFMPIAVALPICFVRHSLQKNSAWQFPLMHSSPARYSLGGLLASCLTGAIIMLSAAVLFWLFCIFGLPGPVDYSVIMNSTPRTFYSSLSGPTNLLIRWGILSVNGALWGAVTYAVSAYTGNQYISAAAPFVLLLGINSLCGFFGWIYPNPIQILLIGFPKLLPFGGLFYMAAYVLAAVALCYFLFYRRTKRRLVYG